MPEAKLQYLKLIIDELEQEIRVLKERLDAAEHAAQTSFSFIREIED
jgi:hypothetical protein|tara:strand:+ start:165 stop:305 length:141 start_codon:yes stop_codon:yes gene_type:complete